MSSNPLVSVIIPSFNSKAYVMQSIQSVKNQSYPNIEIIVVDDGSTDNTVQVLKDFQAKESFQLITKKNSGPGGARNAGMTAAKGEYICFLDADDQLLQESIAKRIDVMKSHTEVDLVFTDVTRLDTKDKPGYAFLSHHDFLAKFKNAIDKSIDKTYYFNDQYFDCAILHFPFIWTSSVMVKSSVIARCGYFNETWKGSEDIDYWLRVSEQGKLAYIDEPLTQWHHYYSSLTSYGNFHFYKDTLACYERIKRNLGAKQYLKGAINKRLGYYAFAGGYEALAVDALKQARGFFWQACCYCPLKLKYWCYALLSFLPSMIFFPLRSLKQRISHS